MNFFMEVAKMRAARLLWAKLMKPFDPKDARSLSLRTHCQTSGWSLAAQDVFNNVVRTAIEAMAATQGHTQSLHTNALDEALALPTDFSARIARNTQIVLQQESGTTRIIDPWGGSFYVERLTYELAKTAWAPHPGGRGAGRHGQGDRGGLPKLRIEEAVGQDAGAHRRRPAVGDRRQQVSARAGSAGRACSRSTTRRCGNCRSTSSAASSASAIRKAVADALAALTRNAAGGNGNLLALAIDAARAKATVGEISSALEQVFGRHRAEIKAITGVYKREVGAMSEAVARVQKLVAAFEANEGRRPRILVAKIGQDGHDRGQKVIASAFADLGFDVDIGPLFATPAEAARQAVENDVHILGVSSLAAAHLTLVPELKAALVKEGRDDIMIVVGGVVPPQDYDALAARRRRGDLPARHRDRGSGRGAARQAQPAARARAGSGGVIFRHIVLREIAPNGETSRALRAVACHSGHGPSPRRAASNPSSRSFRSRPPRRRSAKVAATWCTSTSRTTNSSARRYSSSSAGPIAPTTSSTKKARPSGSRCTPSAATGSPGRRTTSRRRTRTSRPTPMWCSASTGSEALLHVPQCDEQDKAMLATFQVEVGRFECMIDRVADPSGLFKRLDLGKPISKLVRE